MTEAEVVQVCQGILADGSLRRELAKLSDAITPPVDRAPGLQDMMRAAGAFSELAQLLARAKVRGALVARAVADGTI